MVPGACDGLPCKYGYDYKGVPVVMLVITGVLDGCVALELAKRMCHDTPSSGGVGSMPWSTLVHVAYVWSMHDGAVLTVRQPQHLCMLSPSTTSSFLCFCSRVKASA